MAGKFSFKVPRTLTSMNLIKQMNQCERILNGGGRRNQLCGAKVVNGGNLCAKCLKIVRSQEIAQQAREHQDRLNDLSQASALAFNSFYEANNLAAATDHMVTATIQPELSLLDQLQAEKQRIERLIQQQTMIANTKAKAAKDSVNAELSRCKNEYVANCLQRGSVLPLSSVHTQEIHQRLQYITRTEPPTTGAPLKAIPAPGANQIAGMLQNLAISQSN